MKASGAFRVVRGATLRPEESTVLFCHRWHNRMEFKQFAAWNPPVMSSRTPCVEPLHDASGPTSRIVVTQIMMPDEMFGANVGL